MEHSWRRLVLMVWTWIPWTPWALSSCRRPKANLILRGKMFDATPGAMTIPYAPCIMYNIFTIIYIPTKLFFFDGGFLWVNIYSSAESMGIRSGAGNSNLRRCRWLHSTVRHRRTAGNLLFFLVWFHQLLGTWSFCHPTRDSEISHAWLAWEGRMAEYLETSGNPQLWQQCLIRRASHMLSSNQSLDSTMAFFSCHSEAQEVQLAPENRSPIPPHMTTRKWTDQLGLQSTFFFK